MVYSSAVWKGNPENMFVGSTLALSSRYLRQFTSRNPRWAAVGDAKRLDSWMHLRRREGVCLRGEIGQAERPGLVSLLYFVR